MAGKGGNVECRKEVEAVASEGPLGAPQDRSVTPGIDSNLPPLFPMNRLFHQHGQLPGADFLASKAVSIASHVRSVTPTPLHQAQAQGLLTTQGKGLLFEASSPHTMRAPLSSEAIRAFPNSALI